MKNTTSCLRILVVDDDTDALEIVATLLKLLGYEVYTQCSGEAALVFIEALHPNVVISDIGMPGWDGYETAIRIRQQTYGKHVLLIALSGYGSDEHKKKALQSGFNYHLTKPLDTNLLRRIIDKHLSGF
ncbi:response regulator [Siphonobacter sp. SORGH_AS_0500]|uniref:response regulator n=1 Tax=Siphonobacter sp. SORGH_AS_0500 TaxID=1864824 RepID=UPI0028670DD0|nr:response regulator [Siphonobacter sp. SORGH_AS_0500]MDR6193682.1 CheY-like chemotaxis protein [Siphonobacter sp. SORGH_AS_0500]